jgi:hypothetical protein
VRLRIVKEGSGSLGAVMGISVSVLDDILEVQ